MRDYACVVVIIIRIIIIIIIISIIITIIIRTIINNNNNSNNNNITIINNSTLTKNVDKPKTLAQTTNQPSSLLYIFRHIKREGDREGERERAMFTIHHSDGWEAMHNKTIARLPSMCCPFVTKVVLDPVGMAVMDGIPEAQWPTVSRGP